MLRSETIYLNGNALRADENGMIPDLMEKKENAGTIELIPGTCTFLVI